MKVINVAGFDVKFEKNGFTYKIPNDNLLHIIPDECFYQDNFTGLLRVIVPPVDAKKVINEMMLSRKHFDINEPKIIEIIIEKLEEKNKEENKPLKKIRIKKEIRDKLIKNNKKEEEIKTE